jgi:hypothetical protein
MSSGEIKKIEKELEEKKAHCDEISLKYKPLVEMVMKCIEDDHLNFVLVMTLLQGAYEKK